MSTKKRLTLIISEFESELQNLPKGHLNDAWSLLLSKRIVKVKEVIPFLND